VKVVWFIDTSILRELIQVPGKHNQHEEVNAEFHKKAKAGEQFVIPITAVIETGNHIAHAKTGDRRTAATKLKNFLLSAANRLNPWVLHEVEWGQDFLERFLGGDSTGSDFVDLAGNAQMGGGDFSILVERDAFRQKSNGLDVRIWTLDKGMGAYSDVVSVD
jgi:hypothetical protein